MKPTNSAISRRVYSPQVNNHLRDTTILRVLAPYIDPTKMVLDVGGAVGHMSHYFCDHTREQVLAFEAVPEVFVQLRKVGETHPNFEAFNWAIGDRDGETTFWVDKNRLSNSGLMNLAGSAAERGRDIETYPIKTVIRTLDSFIDPIQNPKKVGFIKIDIEGAELQALRGATKILTLHRPNLLVEIYKPFTPNPEAIFEWLMMEFGYKCRFYSHPDGLYDVPTVEKGVFAVENFHGKHDGDFLFYQ